MRTAAAVIVALILTACSPSRGEPEAPQVSRNDWLVGAANDEERFRLIQRQMRGFDQPMWEVGERFGRLHDALQRENYELATYHWDKIKTAIENGIAKRPARAANARALFLDDTWGEVRAGLATRDREEAWAAFNTARTACQSCHQAEKVDYMNDQTVFDLAAPANVR